MSYTKEEIARLREEAFQRELDLPWAYKVIDGVVYIGMEGNLDTVHDATLKISGGFMYHHDEGATPEQRAVDAIRLAKIIVEQHNAAARCSSNDL